MFSKGYVRRGAPAFIGVYACALFLSYFTYLLYEEFKLEGEAVEAVNYLTAFFMDAASFIMPMLLCAVILAVNEKCGRRYALTRSLILTVPVAVFTLISEYINQTMLGADFHEALLIGLLWAIAAAAVFYGEGVLTFFIIGWLSRRFGNEGTPCGAFDFSSGMIKAIFTVCLIKFTLMTGIEIYTAVIYLIDCAGTYLVGEIIYMIGRFLFIFAELFATQILTVSLKNRLSDSF